MTIKEFLIEFNKQESIKKRKEKIEKIISNIRYKKYE
jgi:hypothetical protein